jgi:hypothetical protein
MGRLLALVVIALFAVLVGAILFALIAVVGLLVVLIWDADEGGEVFYTALVLAAIPLVAYGLALVRRVLVWVARTVRGTHPPPRVPLVQPAPGRPAPAALPPAPPARSARARPRPLLSDAAIGGVTLVAVVIVAVLVGVLSPPEPPAERPAAPRAYELVDGRRAEVAAWRFRPVLRFDASEPWRPLRIAALLSESFAGPPAPGHHRFCLQSQCTDIDSPGRFGALARMTTAAAREPTIDLHGEGANGRTHRAPGLDDCPHEPEASECDGLGSAIYYRVLVANRRLYVDYWWFYRYNDFQRYPLLTECEDRRFVVQCSDHEGDWEGVTAVTAPDRDDRLDYVAFGQHEGTFRVAGRDLELSGGRPVVYVARGSHASYPVPCLEACAQGRRVLNRPLPEESSSGTAAWVRNGDAMCREGPICLRPLLSDGEPWGAWPGLWGRSAAGEPVAPRSPLLQGRAQQPWCSIRWVVHVCDCPPGSRDPLDRLPGVDCRRPPVLGEPAKADDD